jgi:CDP-diacylglycerol---glycerol-3-phosphate 3-phosphatidyltransferase
MLLFKDLTISLWLTLTRLIVAPIIIPFLLVYLLPSHTMSNNIALAFLFILFCLTDFFDGYLARRYDQETVWGKILDPIADKFLVYSTLIALLAVHKIYFFWVVVFVGRDFFMMGLRSIAAEYDIVLAVTYLAKIKTMVQMLLLVFLILQPGSICSVSYMPLWWLVESCLLYTALVLSVVTAYQYYDDFITAMKARYVP